MRDMDLEMGGFPRLDLVFRGPRLPDGLVECEGGCGKFVLGRFCPIHELMNAQMEAKRLADDERTKLYARMMRTQVGVIVVPVLPYQMFAFTVYPLAQAAVGLAVLIFGSAAFWYGLPLLVGFGLWLSDK